MLLRDHFRPPLDQVRHWEGFHATWPVMIVSLLRRQLPRRYFAEPRVHSGASAEIDVTTFEKSTLKPPIGSGPYVVAAVDAGKSVTFKRDPNYWGRALPITKAQLAAGEAAGHLLAKLAKDGEEIGFFRASEIQAGGATEQREKGALSGDKRATSAAPPPQRAPLSCIARCAHPKPPINRHLYNISSGRGPSGGGNA